MSFALSAPRIVVTCVASWLGLAQVDEPPVARRGDQQLVLHGRSVADPYQWMVDTGAEAMTWVRAQDAFTQHSFAGDSTLEALYERIVGLHRYARSAVPTEAGGRWFIDGQRPSENYSDLRMIEEDEEVLLVDPHDHPASPGASVALSPPIPSPDGELVLYGASSSSLPSCLRVVEVETGEDLAEDAIPTSYWRWKVSWLADSSGFCYVRDSVVRLHRIGTSLREDELLFQASNQPEAELAVHCAQDGSGVFVTAFEGNGDRSTVFFRPLTTNSQVEGDWQNLIPISLKGDYKVLGKVGSRVFLYTTRKAPHGRIVTRDLEAAEPKTWTTLVPEHAEAVLDNNHPIRPTAGLFGDRIALLYNREGQVLLRSYDLQGKLCHEILHEGQGFHESGLVGRADEPIVRYDVQSMIDPGTAYELDLHSGETKIIGKAQIPFHPQEYEVYRRSYRSFDGTEVPIFLAHSKDYPGDGTGAALLQSSGAEAW